MAVCIDLGFHTVEDRGLETEMFGVLDKGMTGGAACRHGWREVDGTLTPLGRIVAKRMQEWAVSMFGEDVVSGDFSGDVPPPGFVFPDRSIGVE